MLKKITAILAICISGLWGANSHAGTIYDISSVLTIGGTDYFGSGFVDVSPAALTANNDIVFDSGSILDFSFSFEGVVVDGSHSSNTATEGFRTNAAGEVVAFVDTAFSAADFRTFFDPMTGLQRGVFFNESTFAFNAAIDLTGGALATGGTYSITPRVVPLPAAAWLFISALGGLVVAKRRQQKA